MEHGQHQKNNNLSQISPQTQSPTSPSSLEQSTVSPCTRAAVWNRSVSYQADKYRQRARIVAWADIIYAAFNMVLFVYAIGSIMRLYMSSRIGVAPYKVEGSMVITIFCIIFLGLNIWFDMGLLTATNEECVPVLAIAHAYYWRGFSISQLVVTLILIYNAAVYIFPGCIAVLCFSVISFFVRFFFILIVHKYIKELVRITGGCAAAAAVAPQIDHLFVTDPNHMIQVDLKSTVVLEAK